MTSWNPPDIYTIWSLKKTYRTIRLEVRGFDHLIWWCSGWGSRWCFCWEKAHELVSHGGFHRKSSWGTPCHSWMVYNGTCQSSMDDDWGSPYFRKPPYRVWLVVWLPSILFSHSYWEFLIIPIDELILVQTTTADIHSDEFGSEWSPSLHGSHPIVIPFLFQTS